MMPEVQVWEYLTKRSYLYVSSPSDNKSASLVSGSDDEFGQIHSSAQIVQHRHLEHAQSDSRDVHSVEFYWNSLENLRKTFAFS